MRAVDESLEAELGFTVTATRPGEGCTHNGSALGSKKITRGSGTFELATPIPYDGYPHVSFYVKGNGHAVETKLDGVPVRVISRDDLIANKRASGRARDLEDVEELERVAKKARPNG